jgi:hypothetical protein
VKWLEICWFQLFRIFEIVSHALTDGGAVD